MGTLLLLSSLGLYNALRGRVHKHFQDVKVPYLIFIGCFSLLVMLFFETVNWYSATLVEGVDIRYRGVEFYYFGLAPFAVLGLLSVTDFVTRVGTRWKPRMVLTSTPKLFAIAVLLVLSIPTITIGFRYIHYDSLPSKTSEHVNLAEAYSFATWLKTTHVVGTIASTNRVAQYIEAYARKNGNYYLFVDSVKNTTLYGHLYVINQANYFLPDPIGIILTGENLEGISHSTHCVFDNGGVTAHFKFT
jgi:hypothetical protein